MSRPVVTESVARRLIKDSLADRVTKRPNFIRYKGYKTVRVVADDSQAALLSDINVIDGMCYTDTTQVPL